MRRLVRSLAAFFNADCQSCKYGIARCLRVLGSYKLNVTTLGQWSDTANNGSGFISVGPRDRP